MQPTLLILAAGMGSRYGGLKQLDPMGPNGETILDYSIYDATRAGFGEVVFVIRRDFEAVFKEGPGARFAQHIPVNYVFQELDDLPAKQVPPEGRQKPWGTAHAVRAARDVIKAPFAVINADDFYGYDAYVQLARFFDRIPNTTQLHTCMIGYQLKNTLSTHGTVNRGICYIEENRLSKIEEYTQIATADTEGHIYGTSHSKRLQQLEPETKVSMNFWGFTPALFDKLETHFAEFLKLYGKELQSECYLPSVVDHLIQSGETTCTVIETSSQWFGVTYPEDKPKVQTSISQLIDKGEYPIKL